MDKHLLQRLVLEQLSKDLEQAEQAAQQAHETATHEENIAENKYDTFGLEASYLAQGHARRALAIRQAIAHWRQFQPRAYTDQQGIGLGALIELIDSDDRPRCVFMGPEGASMKLVHAASEVHVISRHTPLGQALLGRVEGDEISIMIADQRHGYEIISVQ